MIEGLRQLRYPREFRIAAPSWPPEAWPALEALVRSRAEAPEPAATPAPEPARDRFLADLATGLWRLRLKMIAPGTERPLEPMRRAYRHFESAWDVLTAEGLVVQDHSDTPFDAGMALKVIAYQPTAGIERQRVLETIKPSIYLHGRTIQMGEVIVATPEGGAAQ